MRLQWREAVSRVRWGVPTQPLGIKWVSPATITHWAPRFSRIQRIGTVEDGEWDAARRPFERSVVYRGLRERVLEATPWEDTCYFEWADRRIREEGALFGHTRRDSLLEHHCVSIDRLVRRIDDDGYRLQTQLHPGRTSAEILTHEIGCNIGHDGIFILNTGYHRASIAKILDLDVIPILTIVRHARWQANRAAIAQSAQPREMAIALGLDPTHPDIVELV